MTADQNTNLLRNLSRILKSSGLTDEKLKHHLETIALDFSGNRTFLKYPLDDNSYLILSKSERKLRSLRKYRGSPFPLLANVELFSSSVGQFNQDLLSFGIKTREKFQDNPLTESTALGTHIFLVHYQSANGQGNHYLRRQYRRLETHRRLNRIDRY